MKVAGHSCCYERGVKKRTWSEMINRNWWVIKIVCLFTSSNWRLKIHEKQRKKSRGKGNKKRHYLYLFAYQCTSIKKFTGRIPDTLGRSLHLFWMEVLSGGGLPAELALCPYPHIGWAPCPIQGAIVSPFLRLPSRCTVSVCDPNKLTMTGLLLKSHASLSPWLLCLGCLW